MDINQDFREFVELLNEQKAKYLIVGGYAVAKYGYPRYTGDIDIWISSEIDNAEKTIKALTLFGFGSLDIKVNDLTTKDNVIQLGFPPNRLDIITGVDGLDFDSAWQRKEVVEISGMQINFISLHDLRINKLKTGRDQDIIDLKNLPEA